jgi:Bacterial EndoU nuclease
VAVAPVAELGETTDPKALVPGDPEALRGTARSLGEYGDLLAQVGDGLKTIDDGGWTGPAGDAFRNAFDGEPARWITCGDCFLDARDAVNTYAGTLSWAQGEASVAIDLWEKGEAATESARAKHQQEQQQAEQQAAAAGEPAPDAQPFNDPGAALREQAQAKLDRARAQVTEGGESAAGTVNQAQQAAPEEPNWLESAVDAVGDAIGDGLRAIGETIGDGIRAVGEGIDNAFEGIGNGIDAALDGIGNAVDGTLDVVGDIAGGALEGIGDFTGIDAISDAGKAVDGALDGAGKAVGDALDETGDAVDGALDDAGDAVAGATDDAGDAVEDTADDAGDAVDPDEDDDGTPEDDSNDSDGDDSDGEDPDDDDPDQHDGAEEDHPNRQTGTEWDNAEGDSDQLPDPDTIYTTPERQDHIIDGDPDDPESGGHKYGTGRPNKTEFPERWDEDDIVDNVEDVARNPDSPPRQLPDGNWEVRGERDGVNVRVIVDENGSIRTAHPTSGDGVVKNDSQGNPHPKPR